MATMLKSSYDSYRQKIWDFLTFLARNRVFTNFFLDLKPESSQVKFHCVRSMIFCVFVYYTRECAVGEVPGPHTVPADREWVHVVWPEDLPLCPMHTRPIPLPIRQRYQNLIPPGRGLVVNFGKKCGEMRWKKNFTAYFLHLFAVNAVNHSPHFLRKFTQKPRPGPPHLCQSPPPLPIHKNATANISTKLHCNIQ